ncbi:hypothetical protein [Actinomadura rupiterrae]|uniref:hypothetical protein n=1 Tax=Actinomadura rupiterrae TaxID=559627 RepID=UPI0020A44055|nr:hypothetical protein [Actinomadura rupiterrae]MCP2337154.1 hypothetical protein [Actinomadura rupiterrae]
MDTESGLPGRSGGPRATSRDPLGTSASPAHQGYPQQPSAQPPYAQQPHPQQPHPQQSPQPQQPYAQQPPAQQAYVQQPPTQQGYAQEPPAQQPYAQEPPAQQAYAQHPSASQPPNAYAHEASYGPRSSDEIGVRETSGVEVRIASSRSERNRIRREERGRSGRRKGLLVCAGVLVVAAAAAGAFVLIPGSDSEKGDPGTAAIDGNPPASSTQSTAMPKTGTPVTVGTTDGYQYQLAAVDSGVGEGASTQQTTAPSGYGFAYVEYVLSNPTAKKVLLDFPGDVFVKRTLVQSAARGRCMPQAGTPEDMCTPPTHSDVVRSLRGGQLIKGDGDDKYMPPGSAYLVRATVDVPVEKELKTGDLRLFIWKQMYMADQTAKEAPLPH